MPKNDCSICTNKMKKFITTTKCKHKYHEQCIRKWSGTQYLKGKSVSCPMCRANLRPEWKQEFTNRGITVLDELDKFHKETISLFYYFMQNNAQTCKNFRRHVKFNRIDRISTLLRNKKSSITGINPAVYFNIFTQILNHVFFISDKNKDTPPVTIYVNQFYVLMKTLLLFYKNIYDSFPISKQIRLSIKHSGVEGDIMKNKYLLNLRSFAGLMFYNYTNNYNEIMSKSASVYHNLRKPRKFKEIMRMYQVCCFKTVLKLNHPGLRV